MLLSRKWLREFTDTSDIGDKEFADGMTLSGSKVETVERPGDEISNVVAGKLTKLVRHENSDHMWVVDADVGGNKTVQIVTGAWNIHTGDIVPVALHGAKLPGGKTIERGELRGVMSDGMLCSLQELGLDERDFPYGVITAAAILGDYHPIDPEKPSISKDIKIGDKIYGPVVCACVDQVKYAGGGRWTCTLVWEEKGAQQKGDVETECQNLHALDLVAFNTKTSRICTLEDLHAEQREFPHCIPDGIFVMQEEGVKPGDDIRPIIGADDTIVEFEITPNRPDCLSVIGLAKEAAATFGKPASFHEPVVKGGAEGELAELLDVETPDPELCPRYTARMVRNVKIAPSPKWMRERLRAMGVRPINNIVDITNYVMLEYGQPMHAFDYRYVKGGKIVVRRAEEGEEITTLDGNVRKLTHNMLVIADDTRAVGLAGIMGGLNSEIVGDTADVVFESANFDGTTIRRTALALGMRTEASAKFEKGLDILNTLPAVNRACELVEMLGAGEVVDGVIDILNYVPEPRVLKLEPERINALLGTDIDEASMRAILKKLGFEDAEDGKVKVPSWRGDVEGMADLAEEVARFYGYNNIPSTLQGGAAARGGYSESQRLEQTVSAAARACGYSEIITYSFGSPTALDKIRVPADSPLRDQLKILNPLGDDTSVMRTSALPGMLDILSRNRANRNDAVKLYELAKVYFKRPDGMADEPKILSLGAYGGGVDFYRFKGAVETILAAAKIADARFEACRDNPSYHPGRCADVYAGEKKIGVMGQLHPIVAKNFGLDGEAFAAEIELDGLMNAEKTASIYSPLPRYPAITRDLALVCGAEVTVAELIAAMKKAGGEILRDVRLFDVYTGAGIPEGKRSTAYTLTFRSDSGTLKDSEADNEVAVILAELRGKYGAEQR